MSRRSLGFVHIILLFVILMVLVVAGYFLVKNQKGNSKVVSKVYRVGVLSALDYFYPQVDAFKAGMTKLGYIEGENITYDIKKASEPVGNQDIIDQFVKDKVDLIYVFPT